MVMKRSENDFRQLTWAKVLLVITTILVVIACSLGYEAKPYCLNYEHGFLELDSFRKLWRVSGIYVFPNNYRYTILGNSSLVFIPAFGSSSGLPKLMAIDVQSGDVRWEQAIDLTTSVLLSDKYLFATVIDRIRIYSPESGELAQEIYIPGEGTIQLRYIDKNMLYALTGHGRWLEYDFVTQQKYLSDPGLLYAPFVAKKGIVYLVDNEGFKAMDEKTDNLIWIYKLHNETIDSQPIFVDGLVILKANGSIIRALDSDTGKLLWSYHANIISNVTYSDHELFYLTEEGSLEVLNRETGELINSLHFTNVPFIINNTSNTTIGGYYVWSDSQSNNVIVSLGDTCELLAFEYGDLTH